jgi:HD-GYP domain-containing protein (c-di-GMP phosphodiesterase class II)
MIDALNTAMLELQSAFTARALYPASHPRIRTAEARAYQLLREITSSHGEVTLLGIDDRVIFENRTLPASTHLAEVLFRRLHDLGVDRITFRRDLGETELRDLLDALAATATESDHELHASTNIRLGFVRETDHVSPKVHAVPVTTQTVQVPEISATLGGLWEEVRVGRRVDTDVLGDVITTLSKMLSESASAMLPLASVKRHDEYTFVHTINVAVLSTALAEAVGFKDRAVHELNMAALLHDVGKQLIPHELLNKAGKFTDEEFARVQRHPVDGARLLLATSGASELAAIVAYEHHVRADGTGYPKVPRGWRLNLASRVVQVADVFDALRTHRPYRPALPLFKIFELMQGDVGTMFDPDLLEVFFRNVVSRGVPESLPVPSPRAPVGRSP